MRYNKFILGIVLFFLMVSIASSYEAKYFEKFIGKEIFIELNTPQHCKKQEILMFVVEIDTVHNIIVGKSNLGTYHIDVSNITAMREQKSPFSGVWNH